MPYFDYPDTVFTITYRDPSTLPKIGRKQKKRVEPLSEEQQRRKTEDHFKSQLWECLLRDSICNCAVKCNKRHVPILFSVWTSLEPNLASCRLLDRLLREDDDVKNPYLKWTRQELKQILEQRKITVPNRRTKKAYLVKLERADKQRVFRFMDLPKDIRMLIYKEALHTDGEVVMSFTQDPENVKPALLDASSQIQAEATETFYHLNRFRLRVDNHVPVHDFQRIGELGPQKVSYLRRLSFEPRCHTNRLYVEIDLFRGDALEWVVYKQERHCQILCTDHERMTLRKLLANAESVTMEEADNEESQTNVVQTREAIGKAQAAMEEFTVLCGEGNEVRPTLDGLQILHKAVCDLTLIPTIGAVETEKHIPGLISMDALW